LFCAAFFPDPRLRSLTGTLCTPRRPRLHHGISRSGALTRVACDSPGTSYPPRLLHMCHIESLQNALSNPYTPRPAVSKSTCCTTSKVHVCASNCNSRIAHVAPSFFVVGQTGFLAADTPTSPLESPPEGCDRGVYLPPLLLCLPVIHFPAY
jgi:hypothetical protein